MVNSSTNDLPRSIRNPYPSMSFLEIRNVKVHFPIKKGLLVPRTVSVVKAVDDVSLSVEKGEILGLVGESGCGKSTLSKVIMQLLKPDRGHISLDGQDLINLSAGEMRRRRLNFQMIFQDPYASLNPRQTVFSTIAEAILRRKPSLGRHEQGKQIHALMERVGLNPRYSLKYPHEFSGGQRQRIAIARALAPEPRLIIADEPVSALDVSIQSQILNLLKELVRDLELTMVFVSHDLSVVRYMSDNIAVMRKGKIVEYGEAEKVFRFPENEYTQALLHAIPKLATS